MINSVFVMGRLTRDPELRFTTEGKACCSFTLGVDRDFEEKADFPRFIAWEDNAKHIGKRYHKGDLVVVVGKLATRTWTDKYEQRRYDTEVKVINVYDGAKPKDMQAAIEKVQDNEFPF